MVNNKNILEPNLESVGFNLNRNLSLLMEKNGISLSVLHRNTGVAIPTIKRLQSDPTTNPTITTLLPIANFFGISITQLIGQEPLAPNINGYIENKSHWLKVPQISWEQAVHWNKLKKEPKAPAYILVDSDVGQFPYALSVEDDDWAGISKGSVLIINSEIQPENKDYVIVYKTAQGHPTLKQVIIDEGKTYLKSMNPHLPSTLFDDKHRYLGVLIQIRKNTKA